MAISKSAAILCGLLGTWFLVGPKIPLARAQEPQAQTPPAYPQTADGFSAQFSAVVQAYQKGDASEGRRLLEQFRIQRPTDWFGEQIRPELNEILAERYIRLFETYVNRTENKLQDLARAKGRKLDIDLKPGQKEPPSAERTSSPGGMTPSGIITLKQPACFNVFFAVKFTSAAQTALTGDFRLTAWLDTFVYQGGAFRFAGAGAWPFWEWEDDYDKPPATGPYIPSPLDPGAGVVDELVPFEMDKVVAALKPAMQSVDCDIKEATANRIECKRPRVYATYQQIGSGAESVTAFLEAKGDQTHVRISTGKGIYGRLGKVNWSGAIYEKMIENLQSSQPDPTTAPSQAPASSQGTPTAAQDTTPVVYANWGYHPAPGARLTLMEAGRKNGRHGTIITYHVESSGFPAGKTYSLWMMLSGDHKTKALLFGYLANATGALICPGQSQPGDPPVKDSHCYPLERAVFDVDNYHNGEPVDFAIVSTDGTVRAYARAYPFPIQSQDGHCSLHVELETTKFTSFMIRGAGFDPGESVTTSSNFGKDATPGIQQASSQGEFAAEVNADVPGKNSGSATFAATGKSCHPTVTYEWGKAAKKVQ